jgi:hypothetical protein
MSSWYGIENAGGLPCGKPPGFPRAFARSAEKTAALDMMIYK